MRPSRVISLGVMSYPHERPTDVMDDYSYMGGQGVSLAQPSLVSPGRESKRLAQERYRAKLENDKHQSLPSDRREYKRTPYEAPDEGLGIGGAEKSAAEKFQDKKDAQERYRKMLEDARSAQPIGTERRPIQRNAPMEQDSFMIGHEFDKNAAEDRQKEYLQKLNMDLRDREERKARIDEVERRAYAGFLIGKQEEDKRKSKTVRPQPTSLVLSMPQAKTSMKAVNQAKMEQVTNCLSPSGLVLKHAKAPTSAVPPFLYSEEPQVEVPRGSIHYEYDNNKPFVIGKDESTNDQARSRKIRQEQYREQLRKDVAEKKQVNAAMNSYHTSREL